MFGKKRLVKNAKKAFENLEYHKAVELLIQAMDVEPADDKLVSDLASLVGISTDKALFHVLDYRKKQWGKLWKYHPDTLDDVIQYYEACKAIGMKLEKECDYEINKAKFNKGTLSYHEMVIKNLEVEKEELEKAEDMEYYEKKAKLRSVNRNILLCKLNLEQINFMDCLKEMHSLDKRKWVNFTISPDEDENDPAKVELAVDYNYYFIEWLKSHDLEYDPLNFEDFTGDEDDEEYCDLLVEGWARNTIMRVAASFLTESGVTEGMEGGDSDEEMFRSVLANSPEGSLVENIEIDRDDFDSEEDYRSAMRKYKNRTFYK